MLEYAVSQCEKNPSLWVLSSNVEAQRLYERFGFIKSGRTKELKHNLYELEMVYAKG